jgi:ribosomal protein S15P/S13E
MPRKKKEETEEKTEDKKKSKISQEDFEKKVIELAETGLTAEKIGEKLRREGIHPAEFSKKISKILGNKYESPELKNIGEKLKKLQEHFKKNKGDKRAMRERERVAAQLRRHKIYLAK